MDLLHIHINNVGRIKGSKHETHVYTKANETLVTIKDN